MRLLGIGISSTRVCGVRDAAEELERAFLAQGADASMLWCNLAGCPAREQKQWVRHWLLEVRRTVREEQVEAVILHYSVFAYGNRGLPIFAPSVARTLSAAAVPVVGFLHEFAYPFGRGGPRGAALALSHRLALFPLVRCCSALVVTTERRAAWMRKRVWLPQRPVVFVPIFSSLPGVPEPASRKSDGFSIGVFGFASPGVDIDLVADSVSRLERSGQSLEMVLIGSPGPADPAADWWRAAFRSRGCVAALRFTGVQPATDIAREIAGVDVIVFPDRAGPDSRKSTLAAALAAGKPILAIDGPERWDRLVSEAALTVVEPHPTTLAAGLSRFRADPALRAAQGARAEKFYRGSMAAEIAVERLGVVLPRAALTRRSPLLTGKSS